jgi:hypothetical protein
MQSIFKEIFIESLSDMIRVQKKMDIIFINNGIVWKIFCYEIPKYRPHNYDISSLEIKQIIDKYNSTPRIWLEKSVVGKIEI